MNCPQCGLYLPDTNVERCPRCGWMRPVSTGAPTPTPGSNPWGNPVNPVTPIAPIEAAPSSPLSPYTPAQSPTAPGWPSYAPSTTPFPMYPPAQQSGPDQMPPYGQDMPPAMPPYGAPAPPSVPLYGQAAPPTGPMYGQYGPYAPPSMPLYGQAAPPSMGQPMGQPMGQQPGWGSPFPPQPPQKSRTGLIVSLVVVIVLILGAGGGFLALKANQQGQQTGNGGGTATATVPAATATPSNVLFQDSFTDSSTGWANDSHCTYGSGGYHIKDGYICFAPAGPFTDATISATVKQISGSTSQQNPQDLYGIDFRISGQTYYEFDIDGGGEWAVAKCDSSNCSPLVDFTANSAIHTGLNTTNTLTVAMKGSQFTFSVNGTQVGTTSDSAYTSGKVGISAGNVVEVVYSNFEITSA